MGSLKTEMDAHRNEKNGPRLWPPLMGGGSKRQRDGRLSVLLAFAAFFLVTVFTSHYLIPIFSRGISDHCKRLGISDAGYLQIEKCTETTAYGNKARTPSHLTPFFYEPVQINRADREMLMTVKGVGPALAQQILNYRRENGGFHSALELQKLHGVGRTKARALASEFDFTRCRDSKAD